MQTVALKILLAGVLFVFLGALTWSFYFEEHVRYGVNPEAGRVLISWVPKTNLTLVQIDGQTEYLDSARAEQSPFYQQALAIRNHRSVVNEKFKTLKPRAVRCLILLAFVLYLVSGRIVDRVLYRRLRAANEASEN